MMACIFGYLCMIGIVFLVAGMLLKGHAETDENLLEYSVGFWFFTSGCLLVLPDVIMTSHMAELLVLTVVLGVGFVSSLYSYLWVRKNNFEEKRRQSP